MALERTQNAGGRVASGASGVSGASGPPGQTAPFPDLLRAGREAVEAALAAALRASPGRLLAVDATCGNGHDTAFLADFLARHAGSTPYDVLSLDVQEAALESARALLTSRGTASVSFLRRGHEELERILAGHAKALRERGEAAPILAAVMYNLGFLPRSDKGVATQKQSTLRSLAMAAAALEKNGLLAVHAYGGHAGGLEELEAVDRWCAALSFDEWLVARYCLSNKPRNPEVLHLAWKRA